VKFSGVQLTPVLLPERTGAPPLLRERPRGGAFQARGECASAIRASFEWRAARRWTMSHSLLRTIPCRA